MLTCLQRLAEEVRLCKNTIATVTGSCSERFLSKKALDAFEIDRGSVYQNRLRWHVGKKNNATTLCAVLLTTLLVFRETRVQ